MTIDVQELAREIACRMAPDALLTPDDVGAILGCSGRYVTEQYVLTPGFPKAIRLRGPAGRRGQPRWQRSAIAAWIESHKEGHGHVGGRPRMR